ncbi:MAG: MFS transporter [Oscillospiraceae bacterium]|nr:MFS transporter [Oscillospiraceae bacterium]
MEKGKQSKHFYLALVIFCLTGQVAWTVENMYCNVFIYKMFHASAEAISAMVAASAVAATVTTLLIGALSDKLGKRKIFICGGYIAWGLSIWSFSLLRMDVITGFLPNAASAASVGVGLTILMDCVMTFFGSSANDACFNAWLTDISDDSNRGRIEGINSMMPLVSILVVFGGFMSFDLNLAESWVRIFNIIGIAVITIGISGFWLIRDVPIRTEENQNYFGNIFYGFRPRIVGENPKLYMTFLAVAVFNISISVFMPYLILYYTVTLGMDNYVLIFAPAIIMAAAFTFFYGRVYDTRGFQKAVILPLALLMAGYVVLYFSRSTAPVFVGSLIMMCGYLGTGAILGAKVRTHTPENKSGMFQGLRIFAQVLIPGIIGPAIGAAVLKNADTIRNDDGTTSFIPNANIFLAAFVAVVFVWFVLIPLFKRKEQQNAA